MLHGMTSKVSISTKICSGWEREAHELPLSEFGPTGSTKDGLQTRCKSCVYRYRNRPEGKAAWRERYQPKYANSPKGRATKKRCQRNRRARKAGAELNPGIEDCLIEGYELGMYEDDCGWCGKEIPKGAKRPIDHIHPISERFTPGLGTNDPTNLVASCASCNSSKIDKDPFEWCEWLR